MSERPVKKPRPVVRPEPKIVHAPPEHEGVIETIARPSPVEVGWS